jgi:hypothetical protein
VRAGKNSINSNYNSARRFTHTWLAIMQLNGVQSKMQQLKAASIILILLHTFKLLSFLFQLIECSRTQKRCWKIELMVAQVYECCTHRNMHSVAIDRIVLFMIMIKTYFDDVTTRWRTVGSWTMRNFPVGFNLLPSVNWNFRSNPFAARKVLLSALITNRSRRRT